MPSGRMRPAAPLLRHPRFEVLPTSGVAARVADALPPGAAVTVTCSPRRGQDETVAAACELRERGFDAVPHLAAKQVRGDVHLKEVVDRLARAGIADVFVVGGDPTDRAGGYADGVELLEAMAQLDHPFARVGVAGYPEGHHLIDDATLTDALLAKQPLATYMVTQLCFDSRVVCAWLSAVRARGVTLPCHVGVPGPVDARRLLRISMRLGVGDSLRYLRGNRSTALRLLLARSYRPDALVRGLADRVAEGCDLAGLHLCTFNQLEPSARWAAQRTEQR